jgi:phosphoglucosamine mutase
MSDLRRRLDDGKPIFGTDGVRGVAGVDLTPELAQAIGRAAGSYLRSGPVVVGQDTRRSGSMLSAALQSGFHAAGIDTVDVGVLPSGGISYLTESSSATLGAVVSASHNPAPDNGIKLLSARGTKLPEAVEREIESRLRDPGMKSAIGEAIGYRTEQTRALGDYVEHLVSTSRYSLSGVPIAVDCAHGAAYKAAGVLFARLKADAELFGAEPNGSNINEGCGATNPGFLASMAEGRIGLAFDGDADRLIAVDEDGRIANGDVIMAILARYMKEQGKLKNDLVVTTVMANIGFHKAMRAAGIEVLTTKVGDRHVTSALIERKGSLGGEQSGHIIVTEHGLTGDGLLTAVQLLNVVAGTGMQLRELRAEAILEYPQVLEAVASRPGFDLEAADELWDEVESVEDELGDEGRVLVRASGTEPVIRVMVEAPSEAEARRYADRLIGATKAALEESR